ncbi:hypothetical protein F5884DRAFT_77471 [Xylogone sp. PMI_703]|nr:hypothetical protein F5884DRAFT_77471 [Xylogone sp. PMI_703]
MCHTTFIAYTNCIHHSTKITICRAHIAHTFRQLDNSACPAYSKEAIEIPNDQCDCERWNTICRMGVRGRTEWTFEGQEERDEAWERFRARSKKVSVDRNDTSLGDQNKGHSTALDDNDDDDEGEVKEYDYVCGSPRYSHGRKNMSKRQKRKLERESAEEKARTKKYSKAEETSLEIARKNIQKGKKGKQAVKVEDTKDVDMDQ